MMIYIHIDLENKASTLFGKEAAMFIPSGVMGNLIASNYIVFTLFIINFHFCILVEK